MRRIRFFGAALVLAMAGIGACGSHGGSQLRIVSASSQGEEAADGTGGHIRVRFSAPAVGEGDVGKPLGRLPVIVEPAADLTGHWEDCQTLVLTARAPLKPSTRYRVRLQGDLAERAASPTEARESSFVHKPLSVLGVSGVDAKRMAHKPELVVRFNQPVTPKDAVGGCELRQLGEEARAVPFVAVGAPGPSLEITLRSTETLDADRDVELRCAAVHGAGGDADLEKPYVLLLHTHDRFRALRLTPNGSDVPADEVKLELAFSTPVRLDDVRASLSSTPKIPGLTEGWLDETRTRYQVQVDLATTTDYAVRVDTRLHDVFGQPLVLIGKGDPPTFDFRTGDATPRLALERGIFALEASAAGYPVWSRNVGEYAVECAAVPKDRIVALLTSNVRFDPWVDPDAPNVVDWKALGLSPRTQVERSSAKKNNWRLDHLALGKICGGVPAGGAARGLYLAQVTSPEIKPDPDHAWRPNYHRVLANVTDLGLLLKAGPGSGLVWATQLSDGKPVAGATVTVYASKGGAVFTGTTGPDGLLRLPGAAKLLGEPGKPESGASAAEAEVEEAEAEESGWMGQGKRLIAVVERGNDLAVVDGTWNDGIEAWSLGVPQARADGPAAQIRGFLQSDRGIYRPGETVHLKGLVREVEVGREPRVPNVRSAKLHVEDTRGQTILDRELPLSRFGGFATDLDVPREGTLGDYYVSATVGGETFRERFQVEEFRKLDFEVSLAGGARNTRLGEAIQFKAGARYFFGAPVAGGKVRWVVQRREHTLDFPAFDDFSFNDWAAGGDYPWAWRDGGTYTSFASDGEGETDGQGAFSFSFRDPETGHKGPQDYLASVTVTDATDQAVSKQIALTAHRTDVYFGIKTEEWVAAAGKPFGVNLVAVAPDGKRVAAKARLTFTRERVVCSYDDVGYRSWASCKTHHDEVLRRDVDIAPSGVVRTDLSTAQPGEYVIRIEGADARGQVSASSTWMWIAGKGEGYFSGDESARMNLVASKSKFVPGETAKLVPRTSLEGGTTLLTLERAGVIDAKVVRPAAAADGLTVKITEAFAPNVFASVAVVKGRTGPGDRGRPRFQLGVTDLKVSSESRRLEVKVETEKPSYEPGQRVRGKVVVRAAGKPVAAEVAVSVADEGVLKLINYQTPDPMATFYAPWGLAVQNATNWTRLARLADPSELDPDEGGDGGDEEQVRSNFVSSAFWAPALLTDGHGEATFEFTAPDDLTAFRLMAVAADVGARFGSAEARMTVTKRLVLKPVLPRFLSTGDTAEVGVVVHDESKAGGEVVVTARATGATLREVRRVVVIPAGGASVRVRFPVVADFAEAATFQFDAVRGTDRDALRLSIPIERPVVVDKTLVGEGELRGARTLPLVIPTGILASESLLDVRVDRTGLGDLAGALSYLVEYPYGCLEQTLSRTIPLVKVKDLATTLGLAELQGPRLDAFVRAGVAKVVRHQHDDGLFSLWMDGPTYPHLSVYALYGLNEARRAGVPVDDQAVTRGLAALRTWAQSSERTLRPGGELGTLAMAAFVFADFGKPDPALNTRLVAARAGLPLYGKAFLLRALVKSKAKREVWAPLRDELVGALVVTGDTATVREPKLPQETYDEVHFYMSSDVRSTAIVLSALLETDPKLPVLGKLVAGLKKQQTPRGYWSNTQENLYGLVALSDWARTRAAGQTTVTVSVGDKVLAKETLSGGALLALRPTLERWPAGDLRLESDGAASYAVRLVTTRRVGKTPKVDAGFALEREYLDVESGRPVTRVRAGQLVRVRLVITPAVEQVYVALVDPLPAGFEAVNARLDSAEKVSNAGRDTDRWLWTHTELHDDRLEAFADRMSGGKHVLEYLARATVPGQFLSAPASVEAMYEPQVRGRTTETRVEVSP